MYVKQI